MERALTAAGKLFICGEYAVLWGGVARIASVGPRQWAHIKVREDTRVMVRLDEGLLWGHRTPVGVAWESTPTEPFKFVARAVDIALRAQTREGPGFGVVFEASPKGLSGQKLGLGNSARACVLAVEAVRAGLEASFDTLKVSLVAHADAQGGKGSGGDVAAIVAGGWVRYLRYPVTDLMAASNRGELHGALMQSRPVDLRRLAPWSFPALYVSSGRAASTMSQVRAVEASMTPSRKSAFVLQSDALGDRFESALTGRDFDSVIDCCQALQRLLDGLDTVSTEATQRILALARAAGGVGKVSGAGGGDGCVVFMPTQEHREAFAASCAQRALWTMPVELEGALRGEVPNASPLGAWVADEK